MSNSKRQRHTKTLKRSTRGILAAAMITLSAAVSAKAQNDLWLNPNGGNWSNLSNWSLGREPVYQVSYNGYPPNTYYSVAQFSNGATTPYSVNVDGPPSDILVQNDQVVVNFSGSSYTDAGRGSLASVANPVEVSSAANQTSDLTLQNGSINSAATLSFPQTGGLASLTLQSFSFYEGDNTVFIAQSGPISMGGAAGSTFNYTQIGGAIGTYWQPINFGNGIGTVNVFVNGGTIHTDEEAPINFNANVTLQNAILTSAFENISFSGTANVSGGSISPADFLVVGGFMPISGETQQPDASDIATTGGSNAIFNATHAILNVSEGLVVGASGATATMAAVGCTIQFGNPNLETSLWVGISGSGKLQLSGGTTLSTLAAYIGYNGGTGTVTLSGAGTSWNSTGAPTGAKGTAIDAAVDLGNGTIELDHGATLTLSPAAGTASVGGLLNISGGTLSVLSGSRVHAVAMNESAGSTLQIGLDGPSASANGQIIIDSTAIFAGTLDVTLENGFVPTTGEQFQLLSFGRETGQFSMIDLPPNTSWDLSQLYTSGIITAVPEPGMAMLSILFCSGMRRRRRQPGAI